MSEQTMSEVPVQRPNAILLADVLADDVGVSLPQLQLKLPESTSSNSDTEAEGEVAENAVVEGDAALTGSGVSGSPPPNCAICLGRCKNKCFIDSCIHQFCFKCLCEWSKVKPECPLCKQNFKSIIHNVKSRDQFERYHVQPPTVQTPQNQNYSYDAMPYIVDGVFVNGRNDYEISIANWVGPRAPDRIVRTRRNIYTPLFSGAPGASGSAGSRNATAGSEGGDNLGLYTSELLDIYQREYPDADVNSETLRRYVYDRKFYALPVRDMTGRFRDSSARFYRNNPAQIHRLVPFINRDIVCLLRNTEHDRTLVLECIKEILPMCNILSPIFRRRLQPFLGNRTAHFIHELHNFACSPFDMVGYDRTVQYSLRMEEIVIEFTSSGSSDEENTGMENPSAERSRMRDSQVGPSISDYRVQSRAAGVTAGATQSPMVNLLAFTISTTSEGTPEPGVFESSRVMQSTAINLTTHNRASEIIELDENDVEITLYTENAAADAAAPSTSSSANQSQPQQSTQPVAATNITENIELTSSSSDECEFVLERKPPHLRTPELVSLNSDSDSDVVYMGEMKLSSSEDEAEPGPSKSVQGAAAEANAESSHSSLVNVKNELEMYNLGASTSSCLQSVRRRHRELAAAQKQMSRRKRSHGTSDARRQSKRHEIMSPSPSSDSSDSDVDFDIKMPMWKLNVLVKNPTAKKMVPRKSARATRSSKRDQNENPDKSNTSSILKRRRLSVKQISSDDTSEEDESLSLNLLKYRLAQENAKTLEDSAQEATTSGASFDRQPQRSNQNVQEASPEKDSNELFSCDDDGDDDPRASQNNPHLVLDEEQPSCSKAITRAYRSPSPTGSTFSSAMTEAATSATNPATAASRVIVTPTQFSEHSAPSRASSVDSISSATSPTTTTVTSSSSHSSTSTEEEESDADSNANTNGVANGDSTANANSLFNSNLLFEHMLGGPGDATEPWYVSLEPAVSSNVETISTQDSLPSQAVSGSAAADTTEETLSDALAVALESRLHSESGLDLSAYPSLDMRSYSDDVSSETTTEQNDL